MKNQQTTTKTAGLSVPGLLQRWKTDRKLKKAVIRIVSVLVFAAISLSSIFYALGYFEIPFIDRENTGNKHHPDIGPAEQSIKEVETGGNISDIGADTTGRTSVSTVKPTDPYTPSAVAVTDASELSAQGYRVSYANWNSDMRLGLVMGSSALPYALGLGNQKTVSVLQEIRYEDGGEQFANTVNESVPRNAVELYMGYILLDTGAGSCTVPFREEGAAERKKVNSDQTVTVRSSLGKVIGVYPADMVNPAYTRDSADRALFICEGKYYYINDATGDFLLSDYIDERDNRGLYYDYNPSFGRSDSSLKKWGSPELVTYTYTVDTTLSYSRYGADWRLARELYMANTSFAELAASQYRAGKYYNKTFSSRLAIEKAILKQEGWKPTTAAVTTAVPETTTAPESTAVPVESGAVPTEIITGGETTRTPEEVTTSAILEPTPQAIREHSVGSSANTGAVTGSDAVTEPVPSSADSSSVSTDTPATTEAPHVITTVEKRFDSYRFLYAAKQPATDSSAVSETKYALSTYIEGTFSWNSQYKYAKAFNFSEGRAVTLDDNNVLRVITAGGGTAVRLDDIYYNREIKTYTRQYYTEPFWKDLRSAGHYYYDNGLLRVRRIETLSYTPYLHDVEEELLIDTNGKVYELPAGFHLYAYSDGILILERNGLFGCYHKDGYWVAQPIYTAAEPFVEGLCVLTLSDGTKGMIDTQGNVILAFRYSEIYNASTGVISCYSEQDGWSVLAKMSK